MQNIPYVEQQKYVVEGGILVPKFGESCNKHTRVAFWNKIPKLGSTLGAIILF